jgi:amidohydrolase
VVPSDPALLADLEQSVKLLGDELIAFRRDLHRHPEPGREEFRTTAAVMRRLEQAGLSPRRLPMGTGALCDIVPSAAGPDRARVALRADIDALPIPDEKDVEYRSVVPDLCHACGHDVHTAAVLGAGLALHELNLQGQLTDPVRLVFQPAEELVPGGALDVISAGGLENVDTIYAVHCDPRLAVGRLGFRAGPITSAADRIKVRLSGPGGHTARPHLTADLIHALGVLITQLPAVLSRRVDPRSGLSLVWGRVAAGGTANAIPQRGDVEGTIRVLDQTVWEAIPEVVPDLVRALLSPYGVDVEIEMNRGVPPCVNDAKATESMRRAATMMFGASAVEETDQSLGGEDFAWYLGRVRGSLARVGVRDPASSVVTDLHRATFDVDERAIEIAAKLLAAAALR